MASGKSRILVVDDNNLFGVSLSDMLNRQPGLSVCRISGGGKDIVETIKRDNPDLAIVSLVLETTSWLDLIKTIASEYPDTRVLAYSPSDGDVHRIERAMLVGARGYVTRSSSMKEFLCAVRKVLRGQLHMSRDMEERLMNRVRRRVLIETSIPRVNCLIESTKYSSFSEMGIRQKQLERSSV